MSVEKDAIEEQLMAALSLIMRSVQGTVEETFDEVIGYENRSIKNIMMLINKIDVKEIDGVVRYYLIGFKTPLHGYNIDLMDVYINKEGIYIRGGGFSFMIAKHINQGSATNAELAAWVTLIVNGVPDIDTILTDHRKFLNGLKKTGK